MNENLEAQEDELLALDSIFGPEVFVRVTRGTRSAVAGETRVSVELPQDFFVAVKDGDAFVYFGISSLPPLTLSFELPEGYPSSSPPTFTLSCSWLTNTQICALDTHLADLYRATGGAVVLFSWVQFLKEDTMSFLNVNSLLVLPSNVNSPPCPYQSGSSSKDLTPPGTSDGVCRAAQIVKTHDDVDDDATAPLSSKCTHGVPASNQSTSEPVPAQVGRGSPGAEAPRLLGLSDPQACERLRLSSSAAPPPPDSPPSAAAAPPRRASSSQTLLSVILVHDEAQRQRRFAESVLDCGVCLAPVLGAQCMRFRDCGHAHCEACLAQYCSGLISEGDVLGLTCPQPRCKATPTPAQVRTLVGDDLFYRYDRLLFQSSLDSMTDVVYCPRVFCASAVIVEPNSDMAQCAVCSFAFCMACRQSYHGTGRCPADSPRNRRTTDAQTAQDYVDIPQSLVGMMALWDDYSSGSAQRKKLLEKRYGTHVLRTTMSEYLNNGWYVNNETKNCPHCRATIQKNGGCNHMNCAMCRRAFLWDPALS